MLVEVFWFVSFTLSPCLLISGLIGIMCVLTDCLFRKTQIFSAWPIRNFWTVGAHYTMNYGAMALSFASIGLILDVVTLCLPGPIIVNLQMDKNQKLKLIAILLLGIL